MMMRIIMPFILLATFLLVLLNMQLVIITARVHC